MLGSTEQKFCLEPATLRDHTDTTMYRRRVYGGLLYFLQHYGNDAIRKAIAALSIAPDSYVARDAMLMMQAY